MREIRLKEIETHVGGESSPLARVQDRTQRAQEPRVRLPPLLVSPQPTSTRTQKGKDVPAWRRTQAA